MTNFTKYSLLHFLIGVFIFSTSCSNFLVEDPKNLITEDEIPQTAEGAQMLTLAPYENWVEGTNLYARFIPLWDVGTDDMSASFNLGSIVDTYVLHKVSSSQPFMYSGVWTPLWRGVADCNKGMELISKMDAVDPNIRSSHIAELKVMRALYYYHLVRMFGDVPSVTKSTNKLSEITSISRVNALEIYHTIIIPDLKEALEDLPESYSSEFKGRMTKTSANVILSEVYLTLAGWRKTTEGNMVLGLATNYDSAMVYAEKAIHNNGGFDIFEQGDGETPACGMPWRNRFSKESVVEFGNISGVNEGLYLVTESNMGSNSLFWGVRGPSFNGAQRGWYIPTPDLYRAFEEDDQRREWSMLTKTTMANGETGFSNPLFHKWCDPNLYRGVDGALNHDGNINIVLYRIADAMLIYAEASNEVNAGPTAEAYAQLNRLRERAGLLPLAEGLSYEEFREAVWKERRVELNGEVKRKFDLVRTNRLKEKSDARVIYYHSSDNPEWPLNVEKDSILVTYEPYPYPRHEYIWPIPIEELTMNNSWKQNSGY
ncbi:RagB/SusD family nutrient uptake outer membrane protein [Flammeovirga aprica]|uniref:RagB/SusD family nutrient uptake outer membrane protein n=1 Tax=Flammeovirga aprica JL-4 TaxID=694437 RepID=A0A7X9P382_9BACT|nr:RagB/SusD family nutrient uptake outer membrane protein [Flammeovirga aprica]NME68724.1 RagB/SusD family nutrient uptake outer membrane protein [Flammeovirga aprica JL-4]